MSLDTDKKRNEGKDRRRKLEKFLENRYLESLIIKSKSLI